jgi:glycosyltransferase involved in cell wall biosynthesis
MKKIRVNFLSNGHFINDDLIYYRYAVTLAKSGIEVKIFARNINNMKEFKFSSVTLYGIVPENTNRFLRLLYYPFKIFIASLRHPADIYIICTPALLPLGIIYKILRKRVIYNAQENFQVKFLDRDWIPRWMIGFLSKMEKFLGNKMDGIIVTDSISAENYEASKSIVLPNYPIYDDILNDEMSIGDNYNNKKIFKMVYIGGISKSRGLEIFRKLIKKLPENFYIHLYGRFSSKKEEESILNEKRIIYHGYMDHKELMLKIREYDLGLCIFENTPAYRYCAENTTKLFEYMKSGLPVVVSNFPGLRKMVETENCGIVVDPDDIDEMAYLIQDIAKDSVRLNKMRENSYKAFLTKYSWNAYETLLVTFVKKVLDRSSS